MRCRLCVVFQEKEALLFQKGQEQERIKELTSLCEQQRTRLAETGQRLKEAEKGASTAKKESKLAGKQVIVSVAAPGTPRQAKQLRRAEVRAV